jgi:hypothetical protein
MSLLNVSTHKCCLRRRAQMAAKTGIPAPADEGGADSWAQPRVLACLLAG